MRWFTLLVVGLLVSCDSLAVQPPTLTPTRAFSAPTLAPSPTAPLLLPTPVPADVQDRGQNSAAAEGLPIDSSVPPQEIGERNFELGMQTVRLSLRAGVTADGDLYENPPVQLEQTVIEPRLPGVLFVGESRDAWGRYPAQVRDAGFTVLVLQLQPGATNDLIAAIDAFSQTLTVNPGLIAVIGAAQSADTVLVSCALQTLCDAAVLLSPLTAASGEVTASYNPRPLLLLVSEGDVQSFTVAQGLQTRMADNLVMQTYAGNVRGIELLLDQPELAPAIITWLQTVLSEPES